MSTKQRNGMPVFDKEAEATVTSARDNHNVNVIDLMGIYFLVVSTILGSWILGVYAYSFLWVFVLTAVLFLVWKSKLTILVRTLLIREAANIHRKRALKQSETVEWLNFIINRWWVFCSSTIADLVKKRIDDRLIAVKPSFLDYIELTAFTFGGQTPNIRHVRVFEYTDGVTGGRSKPVSWVSIDKPPQGLNKMSSYQVVLEVDVKTHCEDFRMVFNSRVGNQRVGLNFDTVVEDLNIAGTMQIILEFSMDVPFPHMSKATVSFVEMPEVWFNVHVLKALQIMEVPLVKSWVHAHVMEGLTKALVDPGKIDLQLGATGPVRAKGQTPTKKNQLAQGVLTIQVKCTPVKGAGADDVRYTVLKIGDNKRQTRDAFGQQEWEDICSFFIYTLSKEKLEIKSKCRRLLTSVTMEVHQLQLSSFPLELQKEVETTVENKDGSKMSVVMTYTPLPVMNMSLLLPPAAFTETDVAGVVYVCLHGATNIIASDRGGTSDPYCVLFCDRRRILTTPYMSRTRNPVWEAQVEFFVLDFTKINMSCFVFDWDGTNSIDDDFLGSAHFSIKQNESIMIKKSLTLGYNRPTEGYVSDKAYGQITVSVVFYPVASVAKSERCRMNSSEGIEKSYLYMEDHVCPASFGPGRSAERTSSFIDEYLEGKNYVELTLLQAKDLVAMDRNGFSDPYCEVLVDDKMLFRTSVRKKTLFPKWNESVTFELPSETQFIDIVLYDKDVLSDDFLGKLVLAVNKMKELSIKGTSEWFTLQCTKSGEIQLQCSVTSKETVSLDKHIKTTKKRHILNKVEEEAYEFFAKVPESPKVKASTMKLDDPSRKTSDLGALNSSAFFANMHRSNSDATQSNTVMSSNGHTLRPAGSVNSFTAFDKEYDTISTVSSPASEKYYNVVGKVLGMRGFQRTDPGSFYCKVRFNQPSQRLHFMLHTRVIAKSLPVQASCPVFNLPFEVDRGQGVKAASTIIFDVKRDNKEHLATRGYNLHSLFDELDETVQRWLPLENDLEIEVTLSHSPPDPKLLKKKHGRFHTSWSFRKEKIS